jgi:hypothetical protein
MAGKEAPRFPANVFLEVSNLCDLKCAMCGPFSALNPHRLLSLREEERGFMGLPPGELLDQVLQHALRIQVFGYGEPTINPEFPEFLDLAGRYEALISFFSNGMSLGPELVEKLIDNQVHEITISFSGATKAEYEAVYMGGVWETVLSGMSLLARRKAERGSHYPLITINSLAYRHHVEKLQAFVEIMADAGVNCIFLKPLVPVPTVPALGQHSMIYRPWIDQEPMQRAQQLSQARGVALIAHLFLISGATDQTDYEAKQHAMLRNFGLDPHELPPVVPITELKELAKQTKIKRPERAAAPVDSAAQTPEWTSIDAAELNATGMYCFEPWNTLYVGRNLSVKPCCNAPSTTRFARIGGAETADKVWHGRAYEQTRRDIMGGRYPSFCTECVRTGNAYAQHSFVDTVGQYGTWFTKVFGQDFNCDPLPAPTSNTEIAARWREAHAAPQRAKAAYSQAEQNLREMQLLAELAAARAELDAIRNATFWRMTAPMRAIVGAIRSARRACEAFHFPLRSS